MKKTLERDRNICKNITNLLKKLLDEVDWEDNRTRRADLLELCNNIVSAKEKYLSKQRTPAADIEVAKINKKV